MKRVLISLSFIIYHFSFSVAQSLEECQQAAERNYPLIQQYGLIEKTTELTVTNIQKGWLPQVSASAQATLQSDVTAFPDQIQKVYQTMGIDMQGLKKDQYRVGIDVQQTVFDGGAIKNQKEIARQQGKVQAAQNEVHLYNVRKRVNEMYFGLLLINEQIALNKDLQRLLEQNEKKLASMVKGGTAAESDYLNVKAERLNVAQQMTGLQAQRQALVRMLSAFCGIEVKEIKTPPLAPPIEGRENHTPNIVQYLFFGKLCITDVVNVPARFPLLYRSKRMLKLDFHIFFI